MAYTLPQVQVFQDLSVVNSTIVNPLRAWILGPQAYLLRYAQTAERANGNLGYYDNLADHSFAWPTLPAAAIVDPGYTKLWVQNALLQYFQDTISEGSVITKSAGYSNRVRSATVNFAQNGAYARDASLLRDVQAGDVAQVRGINGSGASITLWTYVQSLVGDPVAAVVDAATSDVNNAATQGASAAVVQVSGAVNCVDLTASAAAYSGLASGYVNETYDVLVLQSSVDGDYTKALVRVISGSGTDDVASLNPEAAGTPTAIGTRGLTATFAIAQSAACSQSAQHDSVAPEDLIAGQRWRITVAQAFTAPVATSGGAYDGPADTTYIVTVSRGGKYTDAAPPQITVSTTTGTDISGPTTVTAANTATAVGTLGVTIAFSGTGLRKGDIYYVEVVAEAAGPMRTIVLGHNLDAGIAAGSEVDLTLYIRQPLLQVPQDRAGFAPLTNWDQTATEFTVHSGVVAYDPTWASGGVPQALPVVSSSAAQYGVLYVEYRAWQPDLAFDIQGITDPGSLDADVPGALDPDNPLKWGLFQALNNAGGAEVKYTAIANPDDPDSWADALALGVGRPDVYGLVPLSHDRTVLDLVQAHADSQSGPTQSLWRECWFNLQGMPTVPIVATGSTVPGHTQATTTDGLPALATIADDPNTSGTQYTLLQVTSANAPLLTLGVRPTDIVRALYTGDGFGNQTYSEFVVAQVTSEDELLLVAGPSAPVSVAAKIEIWRNQTATEEAAAIAAYAGTFGDRRVLATWPDVIGSGGTTMPGYFLNCSLAALASAILPNQGMTRLQIAGYDDVTRTTKKFNRDQLDSMAAAGAWIVTQDPASGVVHTRDALTTGDQTNLNAKFEMGTRNLDSISFQFKDLLAPWIGVTNVVPAVRVAMRQEIDTLIDQLKRPTKANLGGQLTAATVAFFDADPVLLDRFKLVLNCTVPYATDGVDVHLVV
jgi:hypothetical protein